VNVGFFAFCDAQGWTDFHLAIDDHAIPDQIEIEMLLDVV